MALVGFSTGWVLGTYYEKNKKEAPKTKEIWTCSMHPEVQLPKPGKCPKCSMDLILSGNKSNNKDAIYEMSPEAKKLAEIEVSEVEKRILNHEIPLVGKAYYDERTTSTISAWFPGRIDRLFVDFTGTRVSKGDHLALQYSPDLLAAQEELIESAKRVESKDQSPFLKKSNLQLLTSTKEKLRLWGLSDEQIKEIIKTKKSSNQVEIQSSQKGVVIKKFINKGDYVKTGQKLFTIGNLEHLWVFLDVYESELSFIYFGQKVILQSEAFPGKDFHGTVSFIQPELDDKTRTIKIRVNVDNTDLKLKPGMLMNAMVKVKVGKNGNVSHPDFSNKWICPMHPEVMKSKPGQCDLCQMDLVKTESLNMTKPKKLEPALVIPETAVLLTGKRAVVYVKKGNKYEGRQIVLGPKVKHYYIVISGLQEGELVVTKGNFKIDSSLQIMAKPSMMKNDWPEEDSEPMGKLNRSPQEKENTLFLKPVFNKYIEINQLLAKDNLKDTKIELGKWKLNIKKALTEKSISKTTKTSLNKIQKDFLEQMEKFKDIDIFREKWKKTSQSIIKIQKNSGNPTDKKIYTAYCPMADSYWLQLDKAIKNPYYGKSMLDCGEIKKTTKPSEQGE